jgi:hypothetical protein
MSKSHSENEFEGVLSRNENSALIKYLQQAQPSAHSDMVELLATSAEGLADVTFFSPDSDNYAYYLAHTTGGVVFAAALGMSVLLFRLPKQAVSGALAKGGEIFNDLGGNWIMFNPFWPERNDEHRVHDLQHWCRLAYHHALALENASEE